MKKGILIFSIVVVIISVFAVSCTFAANNVVNGIRNFVGGTENVVEDAGNAAASTIKNGMNTIGNGAKDVGDAVKNGAHDVGNTVGAAMTDNNNGGYTATRTSTDANMAGGMNTTGWTWFIIGVTVVGIGVLIWSYIRENNMNNSYIDSNK